MFNFVRKYKATPHLSIDKLEKKFSSYTGLNTVVCSLTELHDMDLNVIYKFSFLSAVSGEGRGDVKFHLNMNNFVFNLLHTNECTLIS